MNASLSETPGPPKISNANIFAVGGSHDVEDSLEAGAAGGVPVEVGVIAIVFAATTIYGRLNPGCRCAAQLGQRTGYYVAPAAGVLTTFLMVLWVGRRLESGYIANGVMVAVVSVILTSGFIFSARPEDRLMYVAAFVVRIVAGYLGGVRAQARSSHAASRSTPSPARS